MDFDKHHAFLFIGDKVIAKNSVFAVLNEKNIKTTSNPDFFEFKFDDLKISDVKAIQNIDLISPVVYDKKYIFVELNNATRESQNALLKTIEEPSGKSFFFFFLGSDGVIIPTLRSRFQLFNTNKAVVENTEAKKFFKMDVADRLKFSADFAKSISDGDKTREDAKIFLISLRDIIIKEKPESLLQVDLAITYISNKSSSVKILLDYVGLFV